jgi:hypothetical protein
MWEVIVLVLQLGCVALLVAGAILCLWHSHLPEPESEDSPPSAKEPVLQLLEGGRGRQPEEIPGTKKAA